MNNYTHISFLLDRSGSMLQIQEDVIGGFNTLVADQRRQAGKCTMNCMQFDNKYDQLFPWTDIEKVPQLTVDNFIPRGTTALLDSWVRAMNSLARQIDKLEEDDRPDQVVFVIITDGAENASKEHTKEEVSHLVSKFQEVGWSFTFLAANQDAIAEAGKYNIMRQSALSFAADPRGVKATYGALSSGISSIRSGASRQLEYSSETRSQALDTKE